MLKKSVFKKDLYTDSDAKRLVNGLTKKSPEDYRSPWRKDYARLLHSASFRRLHGKTQLFPNHESDFYRNRLTHSLEVAQIAKAIATKINHEYLKGDQQIEVDIVEIAGLAHDLGHPPFGHNGEEALDECMRDRFGGFEGNAQTLRILTRIEKKVTKSFGDQGEALAVIGCKDNRAGLNLTMRVLASVLKYEHRIIPYADDDRGDDKGDVIKGYYKSDEALVREIKASVLDCSVDSLPSDLKFKTIECQIMDIADDIAYSTYDLEDSFKAGFLSPLDLLSAEDDLYEEIAAEITEKLAGEYQGVEGVDDKDLEFAPADVILTIVSVIGQIFDSEDDGVPLFAAAAHASHLGKELARNGYLRTDFTSELVGLFMQGICFEPDENYPPLSRVYLNPDTFKIIETLKKLTYKSLIMSPMLKVAESRGKDIVKKLFSALSDSKNKGYLLLPDDYQKLYLAFEGNVNEQNRVICDFIAGMTNRYAMEFYNRLFGTNPATIHKPL